MTLTRSSALRLALGLFTLLSCVSPVLAQEREEPAADARPELTAVVIGPEDTPLRRTIILDATASRIVGNNVRYEWYVNDEREPISTATDAIYTPDRAGELTFRLRLRSTVNGEEQTDEETHVVNVYRRKVVLLTDVHVPESELDALQQAAASGSTYLRVLRINVSALDRGGEDALVALLTERGTALQDAETVVLWTDGLPTPALHALLQSIKLDAKRERGVHQQTLLLPTTLNLKTVARVVKGPVEALVPKQVFLLRPSLIPLLLTSKNDDDFLQKARALPTEAPLLLDANVVQISWWFPLTQMVNYLLAIGVSSQTLLLLLMLPVIATILSFLKQVVGVTTFGLFTPAIISLSFLVLGWWVGLVFLLFILMTGYASRSLMRRLHILYIPKMAIILGIGSFTLLLLVGFGALFGIMLSHDTVFVLLIMSTLVESFLNVKSEQGLTSAVLAVGQTVAASLLCVVLVQWSPFRALLIAYPETILLTFPINIALGRFTGLRMTEYFRFREVFKHLVQE